MDIQFKNLQENPMESMLYPAEVDMVKAAVELTLKAFDADDAAGTFILDGQPNGGEAQCVVRADLPGGSYMVNSGNMSMYSSTAAEHSIDHVLNWPRCVSVYSAKYPEVFGTRQEPKENIPTGLYGAGLFSVMVLNTTYGRFLISAKVEDSADGVDQFNYDGGEVAEAMMYAVAMTITQLCQCKQDTMLRESELALQQRLQILRESFAPVYAQTWEKVRHELFDTGVTESGEELEAVKRWKEWREEMKGQELKLFFQE